MARLHLMEIEDQPWCPRVIRDAATDFLRFALHAGPGYAPVAPLLTTAMRASGTRRIVDLCAGGGGPWPGLLASLEPSEVEEILLTDMFPNVEAFRSVSDTSGGRITFSTDPVDAGRVAPELRGFRTLFTAFHHFRPEDARAILRDAARSGQGIGVFEVTQRSAVSIFATALSPLLVLLSTPLIRPFRWSRLFWTYVIPAVPLMVLFDGVVSCLRTYSTEELRALVSGLGEETRYRWEVGEARGNAPVPVTYLIGYPASPTP